MRVAPPIKNVVPEGVGNGESLSWVKIADEKNGLCSGRWKATVSQPPRACFIYLKSKLEGRKKMSTPLSSRNLVIRRMVSLTPTSTSTLWHMSISGSAELLSARGTLFSYGTDRAQRSAAASLWFSTHAMSSQTCPKASRTPA